MSSSCFWCFTRTPDAQLTMQETYSTISLLSSSNAVAIYPIPRRFTAFQCNIIILAHPDELHMQRDGVSRGTGDPTNCAKHESNTRLLTTHYHTSIRRGYVRNDQIALKRGKLMNVNNEESHEAASLRAQVHPQHKLPPCHQQGGREGGGEDVS